MCVIFKCVYGSHLFGTSRPESDQDFKGVYVPKMKESALNTYRYSYSEMTAKEGEKNTSEDIDCEIYSLQKFVLDMAIKGDTAALDMLHVPKDMMLISDPIWMELVKNRDKLYTKNVKQLVKYCRGQAGKYSAKGDRINVVNEVIEFLNKHDARMKIRDIDMTQLPKSEYIEFHPATPEVQPQIDMWEVNNRKFHVTSSVQYVKDMMHAVLKEYGKRAKDAAENEGKDWKAIHHAVRVGFQTCEMFTDGTITLPRPQKEAEFLLAIKQGKLPYEQITEMLDEVVAKAEDLADKSDYPDEVDREYWEDLTYKLLLQHNFSKMHYGK